MLIKKNIQAYMALLYADGTEPDVCTGYTRTPTEFGYDQFGQLFFSAQIVFPDVLSPGYRPVTAFAVFEQAEGGEPLAVCQLPQSVQFNVGEIPLIHHGRLLRGVEVQAKVLSLSEDACGLLGCSVMP